MNIPQYLAGPFQESYQQLLNLVLSEGIGDNGFQITPLAGATILSITGMNFLPVLQEGTTFYNTTIKKLQFITNSAVPGISNATLETVISA